MKVTASEPQRVLAHSMYVEKTMQRQLRDKSKRSLVPAWEAIFYPDDFKRENKIEDLETWQLPVKSLEQYAKVVSRLRAEVRAKAIKAIREDSSKNQDT